MTEPSQITEENEREISIKWSDGSESIFNAAQLRKACPCASCVNEWTGEKILRDDNIDDQLSFTNVSIVGRYALSFVFSDRHDTGIYTFVNLKKLAE